MATTETALPGVERSPAVIVEEPSSRPILWWAGIGAFFVALPVCLWSAWIFTGNFERTGTGVDEVPTFMKVNALIQEGIGVVVFTFMMWWCVIRPWRRKGHLTWDASLFLAGCLLWWQDPLMNYTQYQFSYNATLFNGGSWVNWIPGWLPPLGDRMIESPLFAGTWYSFGIFGFIIGCNWVMRRAKARWPHIGRVRLFLVAMAVGIGIDFVMEAIYLRLGLYSYPGALKGPWTLWSGKYYQFPLYESFLWGTTWAAMASVRYFRNDKGQSFAERGIDELRVGTKKRNGLRFLALVGVLNVIFLLVYNIPMNIFGLHAGEWPADIQNRSYFTNGLCGPRSAGVVPADDPRPGTDYACPGPNVPLNRRGSVHLNPAGELVVPPGGELPKPPPPPGTD